MKGIHDFWNTQPFDLALKHDPVLGTYQGNCDFCFLKRQAKIKRLATEYPEQLKWWAEQERKTGTNFNKSRFTYSDLVEGRISLETVTPASCDNDQGTCFCTD